MVNWKLLQHPVNYLTVGFMLILLGIGGHLLLTYAGKTAASEQNPAATKK